MRGKVLHQLHRMAALLVIPAISMILICFALWSGDAKAATTVPTTMNFQGRLLDASGLPVADGLYNMKFALYDQASGGTLKWSEVRETTTRVQVTGGLFTAKLGEASAISASIFASGALYFEITLPTPATATCGTASCAAWEAAITTRHQLSTSAYAYNAETLDGVDGAAFAQLSANNTFTGTNKIDVANTSAFSVVNGTTNLFKVDTSGSQIVLGQADATGAVLVLDIKNDASSDPTGTSGAMYYNSIAGKFRCYQGSWTDCITATPATPTLQASYTASTGGTTPEIKVDTTRGGLDIQDADATIAGTLFALRASSAGGLGTSLFDVATTGAAQFSVPNSSTSAFVLQTIGATKLLVADTQNARVYVGDPSGTTSPITWVLSNASNTSDPTGVAGAMYYNTSKDAFRCYESGVWRNCVGGTDATSGYRYSNDLLGSFTTTGDVYSSPTGTGATTSTSNVTIATNRPGIFRSTTGSTATGRAAFGTTLGAIALGGGLTIYETAVNVTTLSTVTERYNLTIGFYDSTSANQTDAVAFVYDEGGVATGSAASANWQVVTSSNATRTWTTTSTAVAAGTWVKLGIIVNAAGASVGFYINGTSVATHTANIPTGTTRAVGFGSQILKSVGTTARTVDVDYLQCEIDFTTSR